MQGVGEGGGQEPAPHELAGDAHVPVPLDLVGDPGEDAEVRDGGHRRGGATIVRGMTVSGLPSRRRSTGRDAGGRRRYAIPADGEAVPLCGTVRQTARVDTYTHGHAEPVLQSHRWRTAENSAGYLLPSLRPGLDLLDVGCGPGTITVDLAARVAPGRVVGIDVSADPLAEARAAAAAPGWTSTFAVGDVYALAADDDSFDVVHAHQVLQHLTDPVAALREMARVCRPGGVIAVRDVDYGAFVTFPADEGLDRWLDLYYAVARRNGAEPDAGRRLLSWAHAAGLRDVIATTSSCATPRRPSGEWWGDSWAGRATSSPSPSRRWPTGWPRRPSSRRSRPPGCAGATPTTAGSACCTANCSSASDPSGRFRWPIQCRTSARTQLWRAALAWTAVLTYCARPGAISS